MFRRFKNHFADPDMPYIGPNVKMLQYAGLLFSKNNLIKYSYIIMHYVVFAIFGTEILNIWLERSNPKVVLQNLQYSMASVVICLKVFTYFKYQNDWVRIIEFINRRDIERRTIENREIGTITDKYTKYSRSITFSYMKLLVVMSICVCLQPMLLFTSSTFREHLRNGTANPPEIASIWMPVDKTTVAGYSVYISAEIFATIVCVIWFAVFDTNAVATMIFMEAELRMLRIDARNVFGTEIDPASLSVARERIRLCHEKYMQLSKICSLFNSFMSPILMLYTFVTSVMLCVTAYQIQAETSTSQKIVSLPYLLFGCLRLFMYCWHSTVMTYSSMDLTLGPYESYWWSQPPAVRKELLLLVHQFRRPLAIRAGPVADLTVVTFLSILKGAYSYYTLLREMK